MDTTTIFLIVLTIWLASALGMLALVAKPYRCINGGHVVVATMFGPLSVAIYVFWMVEDRLWPRVRRLYRRAKKWVEEKLVYA